MIWLLISQSQSVTWRAAAMNWCGFSISFDWRRDCSLAMFMKIFKNCEWLIKSKRRWNKFTNNAPIDVNCDRATRDDEEMKLNVQTISVFSERRSLFCRTSAHHNQRIWKWMNNFFFALSLWIHSIPTLRKIILIFSSLLTVSKRKIVCRYVSVGLCVRTGLSQIEWETRKDENLLANI